MTTRASINGIEIQDRDSDLLRGLFDSRLITLAHASALYFNGSREAAKKRIQKLKSAGLLGERVRKAYEPSVLFLTRQGYSLMKDRGLLHGFPAIAWTSLEKRLQVSDLTLRHEMEVMDVKAAMCGALRARAQFDVSEFSTWPLLFQFEARPGTGAQVLVKPDSFIRIREQDGAEVFEHVFFLELDRSTETLDTLCRRALCYLDFYQRGGLAERFGGERSEYKDYPFRVLMVFSTAERRNNVAERLLVQQPPIFTQVWLSTLKDVLEAPLGPVWIRPRDYCDATDGTQFNIGRVISRSVYRRQEARERFIDSVATKHQLFDSCL
jgi:hypothetical protein